MPFVTLSDAERPRAFTAPRYNPPAVVCVTVPVSELLRLLIATSRPMFGPTNVRFPEPLRGPARLTSYSNGKVELLVTSIVVFAAKSIAEFTRRKTPAPPLNVSVGTGSGKLQRTPGNREPTARAVVDGQPVQNKRRPGRPEVHDRIRSRRAREGQCDSRSSARGGACSAPVRSARPVVVGTAAVPGELGRCR